MDEVDQNLKERDEVLKSLTWHLRKAQDKMVVNANKKRRELEFETVDKVYVRLQPYRQHSVLGRWNSKLSPRFVGPLLSLTRLALLHVELICQLIRGFTMSCISQCLNRVFQADHRIMSSCLGG